MLARPHPLKPVDIREAEELSLLFISVSKYLLVLLVPCTLCPSLPPRAPLSQNESQILLGQRKVNGWGLSLMNGL